MAKAMYEKRKLLQIHIKSLQADLDGEIFSMRAMRETKINAAREVYLNQVRHFSFDPNHKQVCAAKEAFEQETKAVIAECDVQVQEAVRTLQPCLDQLRIELGSIDECCEFSVNVITLAGECKQVNKLHMDDLLLSLYDKIAETFSIPSFAVRICVDGQLLEADSAEKSLGELGMSEDSDVMLMQIWGWAKPQLCLLEQLEKQWTHPQTSTQCGVPRNKL